MSDEVVDVWSAHRKRVAAKLCRQLGIQFRPTDYDGARFVLLSMAELVSVHGSTDWA